MKFTGANDVLNFKELILPEGAYEAEIFEAKFKKTKDSIPYLETKFRIIDTYPESGVDFDLDEFKDPYGAILLQRIYFETGGKNQWKTKVLKLFHDAFGVEIQEDLEADNYLGTVGGIVVKHVPVDRDNPAGQKKAEIFSFGYFTLPSEDDQ